MLPGLIVPRHGAAEAAVAPPSTVFIYKTTLTDTTNKVDGEAYDWAAQDIGTAHANRLVICGVYGGNFNARHDLTIGGVPATYHVRQEDFNILSAVVPTGTTADFHVDVNVVSMARVVIAYGIYYPASTTVLGGNGFAASGTTAATSSVTAGAQAVDGLNIVFGGAESALITAAATWGGVDSVTEHVDAQLESATTYHLYSITLTEAATNSWTITPSATSSRSYVRAQWGAC